jgi:hypothetical protein
MRFLIYGLIDPFSGQLRYVGKSKNGLARPVAHWKHNRTRETRDHTHNWVRSVLSKDATPEIEILEEWSGLGDPVEWLNDAEIFHIAYHRMIGSKITNISDGGGGTTGLKFPNRPRPTAETKARISKTLMGRKLSVEQRKAISLGSSKRKDWSLPAGTGAKIAARLSGRKQPLELVMKRAASNTGKKRTQEQIAHLSKPRSQEARDRMKLAQQLRRAREKTL